MKNFKKIAFIATIATVTSYMAYSKQEVTPLAFLVEDDVESVAACESIGWWDNDGNCVSNGGGDYFCKTDSWHELTDCKL